MNSQLDLSMKLLQRIIFGLSFSCIYWYHYFYIETVILIFSHIKEDYERVSDYDELIIMEKYTKQSKYYILLMIVFSNLYIILMTFPSILNIILYHLDISDNIHLTLPLSISGISDVGLLYYCLLIYQIIVIYIVLTVIILSLSSYLVLIQHTSSQFSIIIMKMRRPFCKSHFNNIKSYDEWLIDIIRRYKRATEFIYLLNASTKMILLVTVFFLLLLIILNFVCIFQLSVDLKHMIENVETIVFIVASMFTVYIYFYVGQKLLDHCNTFFEELCQVPFYLLSVKTQKLFLVLIIRSMKPCSLSIGGLFVSSHEIFAALLQKAFSVATVFYSIRS